MEEQNIQLSPEDEAKIYNNNQEHYIMNVENLIALLQKCPNKKARIMYYEINSGAWCEMANYLFETAAEGEKHDREWYDSQNKREIERTGKPYYSEQDIEEGIREKYRYCRADDILIHA